MFLHFNTWKLFSVTGYILDDFTTQFQTFSYFPDILKLSLLFFWFLSNFNKLIFQLFDIINLLGNSKGKIEISKKSGIWIVMVAMRNLTAKVEELLEHPTASTWLDKNLVMVYKIKCGQSQFLFWTFCRKQFVKMYQTCDLQEFPERLWETRDNSTLNSEDCSNNV